MESTLLPTSLLPGDSTGTCSTTPIIGIFRTLAAPAEYTEKALAFPFLIRQSMRVAVDTPQSDPLPYIPPAFHLPVAWKAMQDVFPSRQEEQEQEQERDEDGKIKVAPLPELPGAGTERRRKEKRKGVFSTRDDSFPFPPPSEGYSSSPLQMISFLQVLQGPPPVSFSLSKNNEDDEEEEEKGRNRRKRRAEPHPHTESTAFVSSSLLASRDPPAVLQWNKKFLVLVDQASGCVRKSISFTRKRDRRDENDQPYLYNSNHPHHHDRHHERKKIQDEKGSHGEVPRNRGGGRRTSFWAHYQTHPSAVSWIPWERMACAKSGDGEEENRKHRLEQSTPATPTRIATPPPPSFSCYGGSGGGRSSGDVGSGEKERIMHLHRIPSPLINPHHRWWILDPHAIHERLRLEFFLVFVEAYVRHPELGEGNRMAALRRTTTTTMAMRSPPCTNSKEEEHEMKGIKWEEEENTKEEEEEFSSSCFLSSPFHHHVPYLLSRLQEVEHVLEQLEDQWETAKKGGGRSTKCRAQAFPSPQDSSSSFPLKTETDSRHHHQEQKQQQYIPLLTFPGAFSYLPIPIPQDLVIRVTLMRRRLWRWGWRFSVDPFTGLAQYILHWPCVCIEGFPFRLESIEDLRIMMEDLGDFTEDVNRECLKTPSPYQRGKDDEKTPPEKMKNAEEEKAEEERSSVRKKIAIRGGGNSRVPSLENCRKGEGEGGEKSGRIRRGDRTGLVVIPSSILSFLISRSCRGALMLGDIVTESMVWEWLKCLVRIPHFYICAHGRPSATQLKPYYRSLSTS